MISGRWIPCLVFSCALAAAAFTFPTAAGEQTTYDVWFVHATDPHLFVEPSKEENWTVKRQKELKEKAEREKEINQKALANLLARIGSLPAVEGGVRILILTGDFDVDPCWITPQAEPKEEQKNEGSPAPPKDCVKEFDKTRRDIQVDRVAELLTASPVQDIYLVPGNNDIAHEAAGEAALRYFDEFISDVQKKIVAKKSNVRLHDLVRCYAGGGDSECYADIAGTAYRLVGFPSYSFKNTEENDSYTTNTGLQEKQMEKFVGLVEQARQAGKKILIVTHVPEIDDPYKLAQDRYAGKSPVTPGEKIANRSSWSTWNVSKKVLDTWRDTLRSETVAGVLAGHLHDSHKEIYRQPYIWSTADEYRPDYRKLFLAPPLAVKNQDTSPIQARGFSLVHLWSDRAEHQIFWYNQEAESFSPDFAQEKRAWKRWRGWAVIAWLWRLAEPDNALERLAVLLIAFLAAFLTVVQIWQIPPAENPLTGQGGAAAPAAGTGAAGGAQANAAKPAFEPSPFASNFGKTVITGLGGLAAETVLKSLEGKPSASDKEFYIVWFVIFFFLLLAGLALVRALAEAMRARVAIIYYPLARPPCSPLPKDAKWRQRTWRNTSNLLAYWFLRIVHWIFSLRVPLLTFFDTLINLIQGKNQTMTRVFSDAIVEQQRNVVRVADIIRRQLNDLIRRRLFDMEREAKPAANGPTERQPEEVRVNISVLSADQSNVFYIARTPGSAVKSFTKRSVAWVSVFTGKIRWYKQTYFGDKGLFPNIILFDNQDGTIAGDESLIHLNSHYQPRDQDYEAFIMFPVPWPQRGHSTDYVKGAIHISFRDQADFERLWTFCRYEVNVAREHTKQEVDKEIQDAADDAKKEKLREQRQGKIDAASRAADCDPVVVNTPKVEEPKKSYESEERMLGDWCQDKEVRTALLDAIAVLGELLRGFNEVVYKAYVAPAQPE